MSAMIGNNSFLARKVRRIYLGNHKGNIIVHAKCGRIVNHHRTGLDREARKLPRGSGSRAE
jgi:hypothetical protein